MFAPVFLWELHYVFRRRWFHNVRRSYTLIVLFFFLWGVHDSLWYFDSPRFVYSIRSWLWVNQEFAGYLTMIHLLAVFLLTPALVVSAIAQARHQRVFELLLSCQQRSRDIVLGHWLAALAKLAILLAPGIPLILFLHIIIGTPWWLIATYLTCLWLLALPIAAWSVFVAIWMRRTTSAFIAGYMGSVATWFLLFALFTDAQLALWPHAVYDEPFLWNFVALISLPTGLFLTFATAQIRRRCNIPALLESSSSVSTSRPIVGEEPIYWKQYHFVDWFMLGPLRRLPHWARVVGFGMAAFAVSSIDTRVADLTPHCESFLILVGFPMVALLWSATSISTEKESQTWDPLRVTTLRADEVVMQTLQAIEKRIRPYWLAVLPAAILLSFKRREMLGVAFICWLVAGMAIHHAAVFGLHASIAVRSTAGSVIYAMLALGVRAVIFGFGSIVVAMCGLVAVLFPVLFIIAKIWTPKLDEYTASVIGIALLTITCLGVMQVMFWRESNYHIFDAIRRLIRDEGFE